MGAGTFKCRCLTEINLTFAPFCRSIRVIAFPNPIAAPVTTATFPLKAIPELGEYGENKVGRCSTTT